jgi:hypothetical protein
MKNVIDQRERKMDRDGEVSSSETHNTPMWVRVFAIIAITASLLFLGMMLADISGMGRMNGMSGMGSSPSRYLPLWIEVSGFIALLVVLLGFITLLAGVGGKTRGNPPSGTSGKAAWFLSSAWRKLTLVFAQAESGEIATVGQIWHAFEQRVGHTVDDSTIYRLLHRHGWRKLVPRPRHPKSDLETQEQFKKTFPRKAGSSRRYARGRR